VIVMRFFLALVVVLCAVSAFKPSSRPTKSSMLSMAGGRSPAEAKAGPGGSRQTEKSMFKELRQKLNTAAEKPGFFDGAEGKSVRRSLLSVKQATHIA
jgi:hypothetical protein